MGIATVLGVSPAVMTAIDLNTFAGRQHQDNVLVLPARMFRIEF